MKKTPDLHIVNRKVKAAKKAISTHDIEMLGMDYRIALLESAELPRRFAERNTANEEIFNHIIDLCKDLNFELLNAQNRIAVLEELPIP